MRICEIRPRWGVETIRLILLTHLGKIYQPLTLLSTQLALIYMSNVNSVLLKNVSNGRCFSMCLSYKKKYDFLHVLCRSSSAGMTSKWRWPVPQLTCLRDRWPPCWGTMVPAKLPRWTCLQVRCWAGSSLGCIDLTRLPVDKMAAVSQTMFSDAFSRMKSFVFWLNFYWNLFLRV